jgi:uncharacterized delta-60 repeat protein
VTISLLRLFFIAISFCASFTSGAAPGDLDASFGNGGKVITAVGASSDLAFGAALQPDGKIIVIGHCSNSNGSDFCVARYLPNGALDTSFNASGKRVTAIGLGSDYGRAVALQRDSKIVVVGECLNGNNYDFCLARYLPDGALDTSFNGTGKVISTIGANDDTANAVAMQPDDKIVVAGQCGIKSCVARYLPNGALDMSFNGTGFSISTNGLSDYHNTSVVLQADGKIVIAATCHNGNNYDFCVSRYLPNGALDTSFSGSGNQITPIGQGDDFARAVALQPDGKIVVAGSCFNGNSNDFCLARYLSNGTLDANFNTSGKLISAVGASGAFARSLALQPDGKIIVAGSCVSGTGIDFCVARYLPSGQRDTSFNNIGALITAIENSDDQATALVLQPDGKIVVAGYCLTSTNGFCLARYEGGPNTPKTLTEYVYTPLNYYFLTSRDTEKAILDATAGWSRTGQSFSSLTFADPASRGINRYYFDQIAKNQTRGSHFYTLVDSEKTALAALNPNNQPSPRLPYYEGIDSYAYLPVIEGVGGSCAAGQVPVYRAFRGQTRFPDDPNHRFTTSLTLYNQLVAQGWDGEGVKLCAPN